MDYIFVPVLHKAHVIQAFIVSVAEQHGYGRYAPPQDFCRYGGGHCMGRVLRTYCHAENVGNHVAHYVSEYVHGYDSRGSELDVQPFLHAYDKGHCHRQDGKEIGRAHV